MTILTRVETLEAALLQPQDPGYKIVQLEENESYEEGIMRSELQEWPADRILAIKFVSANDILSQ